MLFTIRENVSSFFILTHWALGLLALNPYGILSLKLHNIEFDITAPPVKCMSNPNAQNLKRGLNSVQMSI